MRKPLVVFTLLFLAVLLAVMLGILLANEVERSAVRGQIAEVATERAQAAHGKATMAAMETLEALPRGRETAPGGIPWGIYFLTPTP